MAVSFNPENPEQPGFASYGASRLPDPRDDEIAQFIDRMRSAGPQAVTAIVARISERGRRVLRAYAERMASLAVRCREPQLLERAAVAIVLGGLDQNALEALTVMPLIENSAQLLGADLAGIFEKAAGAVGHPGSISLVMWLSRAPADRTLESMGFVESKDKDGFRYERTW